MQTDTTLADVRASLGWMVNSSTDFLVNLNQARQYIIESGLWEGMKREVIFNGSTSGYITLPPHYESIIGVTINKVPVPVFSEFHQFVECGPGTLDATHPTKAFLTFAGDGFPSVVDMTEGEQLKFTLANVGDLGKSIRVSFLQTDNTPYFDATGAEGYAITFGSTTATVSVAANKFLGIQKPVMLGKMNVYSSGTTDTLLSTYLPSETRPHYSRYFIGQVPTDQPIGCLCKLRYYPLISDTDWCVPGNMNALEFGLQAVDAQHTRNYDDMQKSWAACFQVLNEEHRSLRGKAQPVVQFLGPMSNSTRVRCN
jgi:hypothetical protein